MKKTFLILLAVSASGVLAAPPGIIGHNGRVTVGGVNFNGAGHFKFALVNGDATTTFWNHDNSQGTQQEPDDANALQLTVTNGLFSVGLGDTTIANMAHTVGADIFRDNDDVRLKTWFSETGVPASFQEMLPDQRIVSVGFALSAAIADGSITQSKLAFNSVGSNQIINGTIKSGDIRNLDIRAIDIKDKEITQAKLAFNSVGSNEIINGTIKTGDLRNLDIRGIDIAPATITGDKLAPGALSGLDSPDGLVSDLVQVSNTGLVGIGAGDQTADADEALVLALAGANTDQSGIREVFLKGTTAIAVRSNALITYDVSNLQAPVLLDSLVVNLGSSDVKVEGDFIYVADLANQLAIFDTSTPSNITARGTLAFTNPTAVDVVGTTAFVTDITVDTLTAVNVANPDAPSVISSLPGVLEEPRHIAAGNGFAFVADASTTDVEIFNVSNPAAMTHLGSDNINSVQDMAVEGDRLYVRLSSILFIRSAAAVPAALGQIALGLNPRFGVDGVRLVLAADPAGTSDPVDLLDVTDPAAPVPVASGLVTQPNGIAVRGNLVCVATDAGIQLFELQVPQLTVEKSVRLRTGGLIFPDGSVQNSAFTVIDSDDIVDGSITAVDLAPGSVGSSALAFDVLRADTSDTFTGSSLSIGGSSALNVLNGGKIRFNSGSANELLFDVADDRLEFEKGLAVSGPLHVGSINGATAFNRIGTGAPTHTGDITGTTDLFVGDDVEINGVLYAENRLVVGSDSGTDDDIIAFDANTELLMWDESDTRLEFSDSFALDGVFASGSGSRNHTTVGYNYFANFQPTPASGDISNSSDVYCGADVEVSQTLYLSGELRMDTEEGDQFIRFFNGGSQTGEHLKWDDVDSRFEFSDDLAAASFFPTSDRNAKTAVEAVEPAEVLRKLAALPVSTWRFKGEAEQDRHIGPMAQDFHAAFGFGVDDKRISTTDADGVALAAIQALLERIEQLEARISELEAE